MILKLKKYSKLNLSKVKVNLRTIKLNNWKIQYCIQIKKIFIKMRKVRKAHFKTKQSFLTIIKINQQKRKLRLKKKNWRYLVMNKIKA